MKAVVGIGNVGEKYADTRHNAGFMLLDKLSGKLESKNVILAKSDTMMNSSGIAVLKLVKDHKLAPQDLYVVHDDLDLRLGEYKIQLGKGPKVHNGVNSVEESLRTSDFWRVRVGVDNRDPENRTPGDKYVLEKFTLEEREILENTLEQICKKLATF